MEKGCHLKYDEWNNVEREEEEKEKEEENQIQEDKEYCVLDK